METKTETDLVISTIDVLVKQRVALKISESGPQKFVYEYPITIRSAKARDKFGDLLTHKLDDNHIEIVSDRKFEVGQSYAFEISMLVSPESKTIGGITNYNWGSLDLYRVICLRLPYQVLGFSHLTEKDNQWIYSNNVSGSVSNHIAKYRSARVEMGSEFKCKISVTYRIDCTQGGRMTKLTSFGPVLTKRQVVQLLTPGVEIMKDENGNDQYVIDQHVNPGEFKEIVLSWIVTIPKNLQVTEDLGSMKALEIAKRDSESIRSQIKGDPLSWDISHPSIQQIATAAKKYETIFDVHKFLFEFTNRRIKYDINGVRQSPIEALESRIGDCSEYADLLVTLHRAAGIPSRVVEGVIVDWEDGNPTLEGHAWVMFLTTKGWIHCDPTWGIHLGVTAQHVQFNEQIKFKESNVYAIDYQGSTPNISYKLSWDEV